MRTISPIAITAFLLALGVPALSLDYACIDPVVEARAIWIDAGAIPKTADGIRKLVRSYRQANLNVLFPEVICRGYAVYPSKHLARDPRFAGAPDPLPVMIREAHRLGMEVHPWVWVFRAGYAKRPIPPGIDTWRDGANMGAILSAHPDWAELSKDASLGQNVSLGRDLKSRPSEKGGGLWISPVIPAARDFLAALFAELVTCYEIDGLHLDYIRYEVESKSPYGYSPASRALFAKQYGIDPRDIDEIPIHQYEWRKFRERQINTFVQRIGLQTRSIKPNVKLSAAVGPIPDEARSELMQNWANWTDNKWLDLVVPMAYSSDDPHFGRMVARERDSVKDSALLLPGIGFFSQKDPQQIVRQIALARDGGAVGQALFAASYLTRERRETLVNGPYSRPSLLPFKSPRVCAGILCQRAKALRSKGECEEADYLASLAETLTRFADSREARTPYVPPTPPPLTNP